jgi:hypothetical protein
MVDPRVIMSMLQHNNQIQKTGAWADIYAEGSARF